MAYGRRSLDMWHGMDIQEVYAAWADKLQSCSMGAIRHGIELAENEQSEKPPTQGQFLAMCRKYEPEEIELKLEHRLTPEQVEKNKARVTEIIAGLAKKQGVGA